jgi:hypothetical protein
MAISENYVIANICSYMQLPELCSIEAASKDISEGMADFEGKAEVWRNAADMVGVSVSNVEKAAIKSLLAAVQNFDLHLPRQPISIKSPKEVQSFVKAIQHLKKTQAAHLKSGGKDANTFITHFQFSDEDVQSYLKDPESTVSSIPVPILVGEKFTFLTLSWSKGTMLSSIQTDKASFRGLGLQLRAISPALTLLKDFNFSKAEGRQQGSGLCFMSQKPATFASEMKTGILIAGLLHDLKAVDGRGSADALHLDNPTWRCPEPSLI